LRGRGPAEEGALARPERPRRCTLPMTALRVIPPNSAAIWLADSPSAHNFLSCSTRSSVHDMVPSVSEASVHGHTRAGQARAESYPYAGRPIGPPVGTQHHYWNSGNCPPHEMSYQPSRNLQYQVTPAQESARGPVCFPQPIGCFGKAV